MKSKGFYQRNTILPVFKGFYQNTTLTSRHYMSEGQHIRKLKSQYFKYMLCMDDIFYPRISSRQDQKYKMGTQNQFQLEGLFYSFKFF